MPELLRMPEIAAGTDKATLVGWPVAPGEPFAAPDVIASVETDKAVVDVEAEHAGVIVRTLVEPGAEVAVGDPIALVAANGETVDDVDAALAALGVIAASPETASQVTPKATREATPKITPEVMPQAPGAAAPDTAPVQAPTGAAARIFASPLARRLAKEAGLILDELIGSGPNGRIRRHDVDRALAERAAAASAPAPAPMLAAPASTKQVVPEGVTVVPHTKLRRLVASRLTESKQNVPHFYVKASVEVDELLELRAKLNAGGDVKISVNDLVIKAMAVAHVAVPDVNVVWTDDAMHRFDHVDIAVAVAAPNGLVTPVLRGVDTMSISAVARAIRDVVMRAGEGRLQQSELVGGSTTVSNLGMFGVDEFTAIINPPHATILAVGAVAKRPVVLESGEIAARSTMNVVLSVDHRAVDGALAARWMRAFTTTLRDPISILR